MKYWLIKSEPEAYSYDDLLQEKIGVWDGVRNYQARNHMRNMKKGDLAFFYHSGKAKEIVAIAKVIRQAYQDPSTDKDFSAVDFKPVKKLKKAVSLKQIKSDDCFQDMALIKQSRLSVMPVSNVHFKKILKWGETEL